MELHGLPWACKWTVAVGMQQLGGSYGQYYCGQWPTGVWSGVKGDKCLMGFLVVSLVELFHRFKSYGIYSCVVGWMVPQVQVLWDFKLYCSLNGFQCPGEQKCLHIQVSICQCKITLVGTAQPQTAPHNPQNLPPQPHYRESIKFSQFAVHFNWFTPTPPRAPAQQ